MRINKRTSLNFLHFMQDELALHLTSSFHFLPIARACWTSSLWTSCMTQADPVGQAIFVEPRSLGCFVLLHVQLSLLLTLLAANFVRV